MRPRARIPKTIIAARLFNPLYKLLKDIDSGEVVSVDGGISLDKVSWEGCKDTYLNASETLEHWCMLFREICTSAKLPKCSDSALQLLAKLLSLDSVEFQESNLKEAKCELDAMYSVYMKVPQNIILSACTPYL